MKAFVREYLISFKAGWSRFLVSSLLLILLFAWLTPSTSDLNRYLNKTMMKQATNKLPIRSAQSVRMCVPGTTGKLLSERILDRVMADTTLGIRIKSMIELQFTYGLRVSEVLQIKYSDLLEMNRIRIKSLKGSTPRIIVFKDSFNYLSFCRTNGCNPFEGISRFTVYRIYKKIGIVYQNPASANLSITHAPRHIVAHEIRKEDSTNAYTSDFLRHKSEKSLEYYK
jgi:site-specific recombinase XerD